MNNQQAQTQQRQEYTSARAPEMPQQMPPSMLQQLPPQTSERPPEHVLLQQRPQEESPQTAQPPSPLPPPLQAFPASSAPAVPSEDSTKLASPTSSKPQPPPPVSATSAASVPSTSSTSSIFSAPGSTEHSTLPISPILPVKRIPSTNTASSSSPSSPLMPPIEQPEIPQQTPLHPSRSQSQYQQQIPHTEQQQSPMKNYQDTHRRTIQQFIAASSRVRDYITAKCKLNDNDLSKSILNQDSSQWKITSKKLKDIGSLISHLFHIPQKYGTRKLEILRSVESVIRMPIPPEDEDKILKHIDKSGVLTGQQEQKESKMTQTTPFADKRFIERQDPFFKEICQLYIFNVVFQPLKHSEKSEPKKVSINLSFDIPDLAFSFPYLFHLRVFNMTDQCDVIFENQSLIDVNGVSFMLFSKKIRIVRGIEDPLVTAYPIDLTKYLHPGINKVIIELFEGKAYRIVLQRVQSIEMNDLIAAVPRDVGGMKQQRDDDDDDVAEINATLSLRCPLSCMRISLPARGRHCDHLAAFDLTSYLSFCRNGRVWHCPICFHQCPVSELYIDNWLCNVLHTIPEDCYEIAVFPDGTFKAKDNEESGKKHKDSSHNQASSETVGTEKAPQESKQDEADCYIILSDSDDEPPSTTSGAEKHNADTVKREASEAFANPEELTEDNEASPRPKRQHIASSPPSNILTVLKHNVDLNSDNPIVTPNQPNNDPNESEKTGTYDDPIVL